MTFLRLCAIISLNRIISLPFVLSTQSRCSACPARPPVPTNHVLQCSPHVGFGELRFSHAICLYHSSSSLYPPFPQKSHYQKEPQRLVRHHEDLITMPTNTATGRVLAFMLYLVRVQLQTYPPESGRDGRPQVPHEVESPRSKKYPSVVLRVCLLPTEFPTPRLLASLNHNPYPHA